MPHSKLAINDPDKARLVELRFSPDSRVIRRLRLWAFPLQRPTATGLTPGPGFAARWKATVPKAASFSDRGGAMLRYRCAPLQHVVSGCMREWWKMLSVKPAAIAESFRKAY